MYALPTTNPALCLFPLIVKPQMLTKTLLCGARTVAARRGFAVCVPAAQKVSDPIQQLFLEKVREYKTKSK